MNLLRFHPAAEWEMIEAAVWYDSQEEGLGKRFLNSVQEALNRIDLDPELYPAVEGDLLRCLTRTFPFGVIFRFQDDIITVMAVMHLHRDPDYWKVRKSDQSP